ncbi:triose-phosphate isomerase [Phenylobacterium kunshanense]|uniref:Triosephosphate isomerase n=1 Tax=Phenylobacterium kunshanense TaxID=1445034 RepID=A0A328BSW3_9CAUL|nr:triose-phosphate isomerase [Phenylobacterium kunshanense]RAK68934.1 triose-phosphate isomerase [Phenylobacterium kunshanense]
MTAPQPLIAGNWKMNGLSASVAEAKAVAAGLGQTPARVAICPPSILIHRLADALKGTPVLVGGQDHHWDDAGAFTGDISAEMLADAGAKLAILGHSERRAGYRETDEVVAQKVSAALRAGLEPIVCVGETLEQRQAGDTLAVVTGQTRGSLPADLRGKAFAVAYEPVWAIGTGLTPTLEQIEEVHKAIRATLVEQFAEEGRKVPILYGGSVKPGNAAEILHAAEVGGALVGGASLKAEDFLGIIRAL